MQSIALVTRVGLPPFPTDADLDTAVERLGRLVAIANEIPLSAMVAPQIWRRATQSSSGLVNEACNSPITWLASGWSEPNLGRLPPQARAGHLGYESELLAELGIVTAGFLSVSWDPTLITTLTEAGFDYVVTETPHTQHYLAPGVISRYEHSLVIFSAARLSSQTPLPRLAGPSLLTTIIPQITQAAARLDPDWYRLVTINEFLAETKLRRLESAPVSFNTDLSSFDLAFPADQAAIFSVTVSKRMRYTKSLVRLSSPGSKERLLAVNHHQLQSPSQVLGNCAPINQALLETQTRLDRVQRGDSWASINHLDWDQDGGEDIEIQQPSWSYVIDPPAGRLLYLDHKPTGWTVTSFFDNALEFWGLVLMVHQNISGDRVVVPLSLEPEVTEKRGEVRVGLFAELGSVQPNEASPEPHSDPGRLELELTSGEDRMDFTYRSEGDLEGEMGPFLPVYFGEEEVEMRIDGGDWTSIPTTPVSFPAHRLRLRSDRRQLRLDLANPGVISLTRIAGKGVSLYPHWRLSGASETRLSLELDGPAR